MSNKHPLMNPKKLSVAVARAGNSGFSIDTSDDASFLDGMNYNWDDLNQLKEELGRSILEFVGQVNQFVQNPSIVNNLKDQTTHFAQTVDIFFKDMTAFSDKVRVLREEHEHRTGLVKDLDELSIYNRVAMTYHSLCSELTILVGPTISELILIVSKVVDASNAVETSTVQGVPDVQ